MKIKRQLLIVSTVAILILLPLIAMHFTDEVRWTLDDLIVAGALVYGTGLHIDLALWKIRKVSHQIAVCTALLFTLGLLWAELAVGLFDTPLAGH